MTIDVVYQWLRAPMTWDDLRYSLRSLDKNLICDYRLWFCGDSPNFIRGHRHIHHEFINNGQHFNIALNSHIQLQKVLNHEEMGERILYMYDDVYFLKPVTLGDLAVPYCVGKMKQLGNTKHQRLKQNTKNALIAKGKPHYDGETHLPRLFEKSKMLALFENYNIIEEKLLPFSLYLNEYAESQPIDLLNTTKIKAGFYGAADERSYYFDNYKDLKAVVDECTFLNHSNVGLSVYLQRYIQEKFKEKASFEI